MRRVRRLRLSKALPRVRSRAGCGVDEVSRERYSCFRVDAPRGLFCALARARFHGVPPRDRSIVTVQVACAEPRRFVTKRREESQRRAARQTGRRPPNRARGPSSDGAWLLEDVCATPFSARHGVREAPCQTTRSTARFFSETVSLRDSRRDDGSSARSCRVYDSRAPSRSAPASRSPTASAIRGRHRVLRQPRREQARTPHERRGRSLGGRACKGAHLPQRAKASSAACCDTADDAPARACDRAHRAHRQVAQARRRRRPEARDGTLPPMPRGSALVATVRPIFPGCRRISHIRDAVVATSAPTSAGDSNMLWIGVGGGWSSPA